MVNVTRVLGSQTCLEIIILANIGIVSVRSYNNGSIFYTLTFLIITIFSSFFLPIIIVIAVISIVIIAFVNIVIIIIIISMEPCQL